MEVVIVFPPVFDPSMPYLAPWSLESFVRQQAPDVHVSIVDLNLAFYRQVAPDSYVGSLANGGISRSPAEFVQEVTREEDYLSRSLEAWCKDEPYDITRQGLNTDFNRDDSQQVARFVRSESKLSSALEDLVERNIADADIAALGVAAYDQVIPSFLIAAALRQRNHTPTIVFGGNVVTRLGARMTQGELAEYCDFLVLHEGEYPFLWLLRHLSGKTAENTGNVFSVKSNKILDARDRPFVTDMATLHMPRFEGHLASRYLSPVAVLPVNISRRCHWGKCAFCGISAGWDPTPRESDVASTTTWMAEMHEKHGISHFRLVDESPRLEVLRSLCRRVAERGLSINIEAYCNLYEQLADPAVARELYRGGIRQLFLGLESIDLGLLLEQSKPMNDPDNYRDILSTTASAGIANYVFAIVGLPGATDTMDQRLIDWICRQESIHAIAIQSFIPITNSPFYSSKDTQRQLQIDLVPRGDLTTKCRVMRDDLDLSKDARERAVKLVEHVFEMRPDLQIASNLPYEVRFCAFSEFGNSFAVGLERELGNDFHAGALSAEMFKRTGRPEDEYI